jgi:hypothetical protein
VISIFRGALPFESRNKEKSAGVNTENKYDKPLCQYFYPMNFGIKKKVAGVNTESSWLIPICVQLEFFIRFHFATIMVGYFYPVFCSGRIAMRLKAGWQSRRYISKAQSRFKMFVWRMLRLRLSSQRRSAASLRCYEKAAPTTLYERSSPRSKTEWDSLKFKEWDWRKILKTEL